MTVDRETVLRLADEVGFCGYGEDGGTFSIPVPAFYSRLGRFAALVLEHGRKPLTEDQIERLREKTFSTNNPYCPVDRKSMRKAVRAAEAAHGITNKESSDVKPS